MSPQVEKEFISLDVPKLLVGKEEDSSIISPGNTSSTLSLKSTLETGAPIWLDWAKGDPENPLNFPNSRKWRITLICCLFTLFVAISGTSISSGLESMARDLNCSEFESAVALSMAPFGFALTPLVSSPFSEAFGRYRLYVISVVIWTLFFLPLALGNQIQIIIVFRFLSGCVASSGGTVVAGTLSDLWITSERSLPMTIFTIVAFAGSGIGPAAGGYINQYLGWRFIQWIQLGLGILLSLLIIFFTQETRGSMLLSKRAAILRLETGLNYQCKADAERATLLILVKNSLTRPMVLLFTEPIVLFISCWVGIAWGTVFLLVVEVSSVFKDVYAFDDGKAGLTLLVIFAGSLIGTTLNIYQDKLYFRNFPTRGVEARLYGALFGSIAFPFGLLIFAVGQGRSHFIVPIMGLIVSYTGVFFIYLAAFNYLADTYVPYASSALSGQSLFRNLIGTIMPLISAKLYDNLGYTYGSLVPTIIGFLLSPTPFVLFFYGPKIRAASKFSRKLAAEELEKQQLLEEEEKKLDV